MIRAFCWCGVLPGMCAGAPALDAPAEVVLIFPKWKVGQEVTYRFEKARSAKKDAPSAITPVTIRVKEKTDEDFLLVVRNGKPEFKGMKNPGFDLSTLPPMRIRVDYEGTITQVVNWRELRDAATKMIEDLARPAAAQKEVVGALKMLRERLATEPQTRAMLSRDISQLLFVFGFELEVGQPVTWDDQLANPLGGAPLKAKCGVLIAEPPSDGRVTLTYRMKTEPMEAGEFLGDELTKNAEKHADSKQELVKSLTIKDRTDYEFDLESTWPSRLTYLRKISVGTQTRVDRVTWTRVEK